VNSVFIRELKGILLVSFFIMVVPLSLFPRDLGLKWDSSLSIHLLIEICWYALILTVILHKPSLEQIVTLTIITFTYRMILGVGFTALLWIMLSQPWFGAIKLGIYGSMNKKSKIGPVFYTQQKKNLNINSSSPPERILSEKSTGRGSLTGERDLKSGRVDSLEGILGYLKEYSGVKTAILVDEEGLVVAKDASSDQEAEEMASYARCLKGANDQVLEKMGEQTAERVNIHTLSLWICLNQIGRFLLVVVADHNTDELLSVRIMQSLTSIKRHIAERYQENILKEVEG
jgi:predicted regulator of Ras-like GTPase activity (Roadblock/LC7/MglB family)